MKPYRVLLSTGNLPSGEVGKIPTVEYRTDSETLVDFRLEHHVELASTDLIQAMANARILAEKLGIPCQSPTEASGG